MDLTFPKGAVVNAAKVMNHCPTCVFTMNSVEICGRHRNQVKLFCLLVFKKKKVQLIQAVFASAEATLALAIETP